MRVRGNPLLKSLDRRVGIPLVRFLGLWKKNGVRPPDSPQHILLIKMGAIGDTLLTIPAFHALRARFPSARLVLLHMPANREVALRAPGIDELVEFDLAALLRRPLSFLKLILALRRRNFDLALDFEPWSRLSALLSILGGARCRAGFRTENQHRHAAFHLSVEHRSDAHERANNLRLAETVGARSRQDEIEFPVSGADSTILEKLRSVGIDPHRSVVLHPWSAGYKGHFKEWPVDRFAALGRRLNEDGHPILITGGPGDREKSHDLSRRVGNGCAVLAGDARLGETAAVLRASRLVVCVNTGTLHLAAAVGARILLLDGPAGELRWGPVSRNARVIRSPAYCSPCLHLGFEYQCRTGWCMSEISVDEVYRAACECLAAAGARNPE